jgi:membrane-bound metal-dependent hydrolase YbcI (DUF457 family)
MTSFEHAMLGINGVLASGLQKRGGYQLVAIAAVAAVLPDWDGATLVVNRWAFVTGHRVWGHNLLACLILGIAVGWLDYRFDLVTRAGRWITHWLKTKLPPETFELRREFRLSGWTLWVAICTLAAVSHLLGDLVVSGTKSLPDWHVQLLWPFSDQGWVFPLVSWGDPTLSVVFVAGMFAMLKWPQHLQRIAGLTLSVLVAYFAVRGVN